MFDVVQFFGEEPQLSSVEDALKWIDREWAEYDGRWRVVDGDIFRCATSKERGWLEGAAAIQEADDDV